MTPQSAHLPTQTNHVLSHINRVGILGVRIHENLGTQVQCRSQKFQKTVRNLLENCQLQKTVRTESEMCQITV